MSDPEPAFDQYLSNLKSDQAEVGGSSLIEVLTFGANPGDLRMLTYAPATLRARASLVVVLHGCMQSAAGYARGAGRLELADRHGLALLCPEQRVENNANRCFNWYLPGDVARGEGEAGSIRAMIEHVRVEQSIDRRRVFVTGLSAGGAMACAMLASYPEVFAAGAIIAGLPFGSADNMKQALDAMMQGRNRAPADWGDRVRTASDHAGPWPKISIWHGDSDRTVAPANADAIAAQWVNVHGAPRQPVHYEVRGKLASSVWGSNGKRLVELHILRGLAHGAPVTTSGVDACGAVGPFLLEADVSSSAQSVAFWGIAAKPTLFNQCAPAMAAIIDIARLAKTRGARTLRRALDLSHSQADKSFRVRFAKHAPIDVGKLIKKALTAAGLIRE
jgi:feruloyl esterase